MTKLPDKPVWMTWGPLEVEPEKLTSGFCWLYHRRQTWIPAEVLVFKNRVASIRCLDGFISWQDVKQPLILGGMQGPKGVMEQP